MSDRIITTSADQQHLDEEFNQIFQFAIAKTTTFVGQYFNNLKEAMRVLIESPHFNCSLTDHGYHSDGPTLKIYRVYPEHSRGILAKLFKKISSASPERENQEQFFKTYDFNDGFDYRHECVVTMDFETSDDQIDVQCDFLYQREKSLQKQVLFLNGQNFYTTLDYALETALEETFYVIKKAIPEFRMAKTKEQLESKYIIDGQK